MARTESSELSSPDPLALSPTISRRPGCLSSPLRSTSGNVMRKTATPTRNMTSPAKTITMSTGKAHGASPWKIRVTVEAQPEDCEDNDENDPFRVSVTKPKGRGRTVKVPLKGPDSSPTSKRGRQRAPAGKKTRRARTPVRRKRTSVTKVDSEDDSQDDSRDQDFTLKPKSKKGRRKQSISKLILGSDIDTSEHTDHSVQPLQTEDISTVEDSELPSHDHPDALDMPEIPSPPTFSSINTRPERYPLESPAAQNPSPAVPSQLPEVKRRLSNDRKPEKAIPTPTKKPSPSKDHTPPKRTARPSFNFTKLTPVGRRAQETPTESQDEGDDSVSEVHYQSIKGRQCMPKEIIAIEDEEEDATMDAERSSDDEDDIAPAEYEVGEKTMLDSEGFSMVSLESVETGRDVTTTADTLQPEKSQMSVREITQLPRNISISTTVSSSEEHGSQLLTPSPSGSSMANIESRPGTPSIMPSSPPAVRASEEHTPSFARPSLSQPPQIAVPSSHHRVTTPQMSKVAGLGMALQGIVKSPILLSCTTKSKESADSADNSLFHGFSANTRRQLHAGLKLGEELARRSPCPASVSSSNGSTGSVNYPRLPTPEDNEQASVTVPLPPTEKVDIQYPSMSAAQPDDHLSSSVRSYDEMSWMPTTAPKDRPTCISPDSMEAQWQREREAVSRQIEQADPNEVIVVNDKEDTDEGISELSVVTDLDEKEDDLSKLEQLFSDDSNAQVRRPKISRTWRRRSSGGFAYRDEPPLGSSPRALRHKESGGSSSSSDAVTTLWQPGTRIDTVRKPRSRPHRSPPSVPVLVPVRVETSSSTETLTSSTSASTPSLEPATTTETLTSTSEGSVQTPLESPGVNDSMTSDDTGLFWHRNLPAVFKEKPRPRPRKSSSMLKSDKLDLSALLTLETPIDVSPLRTPGRGFETPTKVVHTPVQDFQTPTKVLHTPVTGLLTPKRDLLTPGLRSALKTPGMSRTYDGSPLKSVVRVSFADVDEMHEISALSSSGIEMEELETSVCDTMASDVRQLHAEMLVSHYVGQQRDSEDEGEVEESETTTELTNGKSSMIDVFGRSISEHSMSNVSEDSEAQVSDSAEDEEIDEAITPRRSRLSIQPTRVYQPLFEEGYSQTDAEIVREVIEKGSASTDPGIVNRLASYLWSYLPFTGAKITARINHPLLADLPLLPRVEPWTKTHYKVLDRLYRSFKKSPKLFSPEHPINTCLASVIEKKQRYRSGSTNSWQEFSFADWNDAEIKNWGYEVHLTESHIVVAALYSQLLALNNVGEYEQLAGTKIVMGDCNPGLAGQDIGVDKIVFRLFSLIHGEMVRADEKKGKKIGRSKGTGWYRFKGEQEWRNYM
ncbi:hypothetical protein NA57DRAFT_75220 [Rhizodiscina lignyota]|uniref:Uncharacterized protein n=1 Tax=Rhizodiscina lignyota TaxID=1504668 RepID=A0A9P4M9U0_9PEZI|nr:hypothetical protein NA57DRAFT_75220 [Rhizodiscina lignyota]